MNFEMKYADYLCISKAFSPLPRSLVPVAAVHFGKEFNYYVGQKNN